MQTQFLNFSHINLIPHTHPILNMCAYQFSKKQLFQRAYGFFEKKFPKFLRFWKLFFTVHIIFLNYDYYEEAVLIMHPPSRYVQMPRNCIHWQVVGRLRTHLLRADNCTMCRHNNNDYVSLKMPIASKVLELLVVAFLYYL